MPKVLVVAQVEDGAKWEASFRTHGDIFKTYGLKGPAEYGVSGNNCAVCVEPENVQAFLQTLQDQATADAMKADGVKRETVNVFVLDKQLKF
jgi:hypothetical protein